MTSPFSPAAGPSLGQITDKRFLKELSYALPSTAIPRKSSPPLAMPASPSSTAEPQTRRRHHHVRDFCSRLHRLRQLFLVALRVGLRQLAALRRLASHGAACGIGSSPGTDACGARSAVALGASGSAALRLGGLPPGCALQSLISSRLGNTRPPRRCGYPPSPQWRAPTPLAPRRYRRRASSSAPARSRRSCSWTAFFTRGAG